MSAKGMPGAEVIYTEKAVERPRQQSFLMSIIWPVDTNPKLVNKHPVRGYLIGYLNVNGVSGSKHESPYTSHEVFLCEDKRLRSNLESSAIAPFVVSDLPQHTFECGSTDTVIDTTPVNDSKEESFTRTVFEPMTIEELLPKIAADNLSVV